MIHAMCSVWRIRLQFNPKSPRVPPVFKSLELWCSVLSVICIMSLTSDLVLTLKLMKLKSLLMHTEGLVTLTQPHWGGTGPALVVTLQTKLLKMWCTAWPARGLVWTDSGSEGVWWAGGSISNMLSGAAIRDLDKTCSYLDRGSGTAGRTVNSIRAQVWVDEKQWQIVPQHIWNACFEQRKHRHKPVSHITVDYNHTSVHVHG